MYMYTWNCQWNKCACYSSYIYATKQHHCPCVTICMSLTLYTQVLGLLTASLLYISHLHTLSYILYTRTQTHTKSDTTPMTYVLNMQNLYPSLYNNIMCMYTFCLTCAMYDMYYAEFIHGDITHGNQHSCGGLHWCTNGGYTTWPEHYGSLLQGLLIANIPVSLLVVATMQLRLLLNMSVS